MELLDVYMLNDDVVTKIIGIWLSERRCYGVDIL